MKYMKDIPDKHFDLAIVDPPYGIGESASRNNTGDRSSKYWNNPNSQKYKPFDDSKAPEQIYFDELFRVSKNQIIWGGIYFSDKLYISSGWIVWNKRVDIKEHLSMCEMAWSSYLIRTKMFTHLWAGCKKETPEERIHPTQKPVALYKWLLTNYAKPNDKLLDTHSGSGSFRIAAHDMGFDLVSCELDPDYCRDNEARFQNHIKQIDLFAPEEIQKNIYTQGNLF